MASNHRKFNLIKFNCWGFLYLNKWNALVLKIIMSKWFNWKSVLTAYYILVKVCTFDDSSFSHPRLCPYSLSLSLSSHVMEGNPFYHNELSQRRFFMYLYMHIYNVLLCVWLLKPSVICLWTSSATAMTYLDFTFSVSFFSPYYSITAGSLQIFLSANICVYLLLFHICCTYNLMLLYF